MGRLTSPVVRAAGGMVWRNGMGSGVEVVVVHRPKYDDWSLPKGKCDPGESDEACALREVEEETGFRVRLGAELSPASYVDRKGRPKRVRYWTMTLAGDDDFVSNDEVDEIRWCTPAEAAELLSYDVDRRVLASFVPG
ncbi:MAG TPA: NUDIX hydrolase [Acidimicrobiales bacterium]|nr:NUDIX hydrolase [Acidimicrobiales bacterium]